MSAFAEIFDATSAFLKSKGVSPKITKGRKAPRSAIEKFNKSTGVTLPQSFSSFYTEFGNGFEFNWDKDEDMWAQFSMPSLDRLKEERENWLQFVRSFLDDPTSFDGCIDEEYRPKAFNILRKMEARLPIWKETKRGPFSLWTQPLDASCSTSTIGTMASEALQRPTESSPEKTWKSFQNWSRVCFRPPTSLFWGDFNSFKAIKWTTEYLTLSIFGPGVEAVSNSCELIPRKDQLY